MNISLFSVSCDNSSDSESNNPLYIKGRNCKNNNQYEKAAKFFEEYLNINPKSGRTHHELASIYHDHLNEPLLAVYHYRQYLKYLPESKADEAATVSLWMQTAEKEYYGKLKDKYDDLSEITTLKKENFRLKTQNEKLKRYVKHLISQNRRFSSMVNHQNKAIHENLNNLPATVLKPEKTVPALKPENSSAFKTGQGAKYNHYIVKKGDTLSKISTRFYGTPKYFKVIYDFNKKNLPSLSQIKPGQTLVIPVKPELNAKEP